MYKFIVFVYFVTGVVFAGNAQRSLNSFSGQNIGHPLLEGNFHYHKTSQSFTLSGAGYNMWFERDEFYIVSQQVEGDFILSSNLKFLGKGINPHRKIGLIIRDSDAENAIYMDGAVHGDGLTSLQCRKEIGAETLEIPSEIISPEFMQVERKDNQFILRISKDNKPLKEIARVELKMRSSVLAGMFICSLDKEVLEKAKFWNVRLEKPADEGVNGYQKPSPSRLEILDLETGLRKIVYETQDHIEAPNWSKNGNYLIYNLEGRLYKFNLINSGITEINTDFVISNNNDHGISFDGKTLAISSATNVQGSRKSIIYTVPITGGIPKRITEKGPSYWHGWSPDGKWLTYCAERNGNYDVYKIPSVGGKEIRLTKAPGLDDGPEFTPDGKYIYFNSTRSGSMQIWRMMPDGSAREQITNDNFQNWFAHPSPNGKQMVIISYLPEVPANSHPRNKRVMLRTLQLNGGDIKTVAFLYGGQGTINVPSWSPDSKKLAFVSYTY